MKHYNLTLIGMPGAGKTEIGRRIADRISYEFCDVDKKLIELMAERTGRTHTIQSLVDELGDQRFIELEGGYILGINTKYCVISPGGSCVLYQPAMEHLRRTSYVVFINVPLQILEKRLSDDNMRGIVGRKDKPLRKIYEERYPLYLKYAHFTLDADDERPDTTTNRLLELIKS